MPTISSVPATFVVNNATGVTVTFAIPAGTWSSGNWERVGTITLFLDNYHEQIVTTHGTIETLITGNGSVDTVLAATSGQITDINSAAGSNLSVKVRQKSADLATGGGKDTISSFTLTLSGTPATTDSDSLGTSATLSKTVTGSTNTSATFRKTVLGSLGSAATLLGPFDGIVPISATLQATVNGTLGVVADLIKTINGSLGISATITDGESGSLNTSATLRKTDPGNLNVSATLRETKYGNIGISAYILSSDSNGSLSTSATLVPKQPQIIVEPNISGPIVVQNNTLNHRRRGYNESIKILIPARAVPQDVSAMERELGTIQHGMDSSGNSYHTTEEDIQRKVQRLITQFLWRIRH